MPRIRVEPEDFVVEEMPLFPPVGEGPHTLLRIEKRLRTTDAVARDLAGAVGVPDREVGYAGRKDRVAITRQWFSVPEIAPEAAHELKLRGARVLEAVRHPHKLRVGQLLGNRFQLRVRDVDQDAADAARPRIAEIGRRGLPNRFGRQRFGRDGENVTRGAEILRRSRFRGDRRDALLMISALQSAVFNRVLEERSETFDQLLPGDVVVVHATGSHHWIGDPEGESKRLASFEISPTGPIFGTKMRGPRAAAAAVEEAALAHFGLPTPSRLTVPRGLRIPGGRRPLRVNAGEVRNRWSAGVLELEFALPAGSYATVLVEALFADSVEDAAGSTGGSPDADEAH